MVTFSTTRLTSKGQIVIPEDIRNRLGLKKGTQFIIMGEGDSIILKTIAAPSMEDFGQILEKVSQSVQESGIKAADVSASIKRYRSTNKK
ncbi:MAG: AbrB/MazE/SpoVT family DNA-binding domain-containing protein [Candidatus Omnitrophica bacterium]|nr:AbrB/MazE/SpoVT family DNA-binding domain-containing protein [Candidatus Omnitrophota bacterium]